MPRAAAARRLRGSGRLSQVIIAGPRGIDFDIERGRLGRAQMAKRTLRRRAAADVPEADEQNPEGLFESPAAFPP